MLLNRWIFACSSNPITAVMTGGRGLRMGITIRKNLSLGHFIQVMKSCSLILTKAGSPIGEPFGFEWKSK